MVPTVYLPNKYTPNSDIFYRLRRDKIQDGLDGSPRSRQCVASTPARVHPLILSCSHTDAVAVLAEDVPARNPTAVPHFLHRMESRAVRRLSHTRRALSLTG